MSDAPERIWLSAPDEVWFEDGEGRTEYTRSDIAERQIAELRAERDEARGIVRDIHWMAVRYADNRKSYAVGMCNDALRKAYDGGWLVYRDGRQNDIDPQYARDGMFDVEWRSAVDSATARAEAAEAENARLRALPLKDEVERVVEPFAEIADTEDEVGREPGCEDDDRIIVVQAHGCQLAELTVGDFRAAAALLSRLRAGEQEGWRTMDSAPRDGTNILYRNKFREIGFCHWDGGYDEGDQPCWWDNEADQEVCPVIWLPADILPALPAAPSDPGGDRG